MAVTRYNKVGKSESCDEVARRPSLCCEWPAVSARSADADARLVANHHPQIEASMYSARVLIVEDEPMIGELLCDILESHGFQSRLALTGQEGMTQAAHWQPDLVVLDVMLPDVNGFEVCRSIRSNAVDQSPGIVMLTGMISHEGRVQAFGSGTDRFLTKPFTVTSLVDEIESVLREYHSGSDGLRSSVSLSADEEPLLEKQVSELLVHLAQKTPLSPREIESIGQTLLDLGRRIREWDHSHLRAKEKSPPRWELVCQVYRDRMETHLTCSDVSLAPERDRLHELFELSSNREEIPIDHSLANRIDFPDHGSVAVLTRNYTQTPP
jgi:two-component system, OmpR family, response regulator